MTAERTRESISAVCACVRCSVGKRKVIASQMKTRHRRFVGICEGLWQSVELKTISQLCVALSKNYYAKQRRHPAEKRGADSLINLRCHRTRTRSAP